MTASDTTRNPGEETSAGSGVGPSAAPVICPRPRSRKQRRTAIPRRCADLATATERAQATMLSFTDIFQLLALLFLAMLPLIFLMRSPRAGKGAAPAMH